MGIFGRELFEAVLAAAGMDTQGQRPVYGRVEARQERVEATQTRAANPTAELEEIWQRTTSAEQARREAEARTYRENTEAILADDAFLDGVVEGLLRRAVENQRKDPQEHGPVAELTRGDSLLAALRGDCAPRPLDDEPIFEEIERRCNKRLAGGHYYAIVHEGTYLERSVVICCRGLC